jgi:hypothetical protein
MTTPGARTNTIPTQSAPPRGVERRAVYPRRAGLTRRGYLLVQLFHSGASLMLGRGTPLPVVPELLGHDRSLYRVRKSRHNRG